MDLPSSLLRHEACGQIFGWIYGVEWMGNDMEGFRVSVEECLMVGGWWRTRQRGWKKVEWLLCFLGTRMVFLGCFAS